jgi:hypothetical protein
MVQENHGNEHDTHGRITLLTGEGGADIHLIRDNGADFRDIARPAFCHFACDAAGRRLLSDSGPTNDGGRLFLAELGDLGTDPARRWTCLLNPRSSWKKEAHVHPFLSPDGTMGFFNSDESSRLQAYMVTGLEKV